MPMTITTIAKHEATIAEMRAERARRIEEQVDPGDCALSSWAESATQSGAEAAIAALRLGAEAGFDGPAKEVGVLVDADGVEVSRALISTRYGLAWKLSRPLPTGKIWVDYDRTEKRGFRVERRVVPVEREMKGHAAFVGCPMSWQTIPLDRSYRDAPEWYVPAED